MRRRDENILTLLSQMPWWISVCVAAILYVVFKFVIPSLEFESPVFKAMAPAAGKLAWVSAIFLLPAAVSAVESMRKRKLLEKQSGVDTIRSLTWKEFEELVAEAYRRQGYTAKENVRAGPDGGIDITLKKGGELTLVQCKHWLAYKVGVSVVREMLGLITAHQASGGIVVTCGQFTQEAWSFASGNGIELVEGTRLAKLVQGLQTHPAVTDRTDSLPPPAKSCARCGADLVLRTAKRGQRAGSKFWGCSSYPRCKFTEDFHG